MALLPKTEFHSTQSALSHLPCGLEKGPEKPTSLWGKQAVSLERNVVQSLSHFWLFATPWPAAHQNSLSFTISQNLLKLMSIESMIPSNHLILCCSLLLLPSIFPSLSVSSSELPLRIRLPKDWSFSFSMSSSNEYSGLISFRIDWFELLAVQVTLKSLLQHHNLKASIKSMV